MNGYAAANSFGADFAGSLDASVAGVYQITFGSDDAGYLFVNGALAISELRKPRLLRAHRELSLQRRRRIQFEMQCSNAYCCGAAVGLSVPDGVAVRRRLSAAPEPATRALMGLGFAGLGFAGFRARRTVAVAA